MTPPLPAHPLPPDQSRIFGTQLRPVGAQLSATAQGGAAGFAFLAVFDGAGFDGAGLGGPETTPPTPKVTEGATASDQDGRPQDTASEATPESPPPPADGAARQPDPAPLPFWAAAAQRHPVNMGVHGPQTASDDPRLDRPEIVTKIAKDAGYPQTARIGDDGSSGHQGDAFSSPVMGQGIKAAEPSAPPAIDRSANPLAGPDPTDWQSPAPAGPVTQPNPTAIPLPRSSDPGTAAITPLPKPTPARAAAGVTAFPNLPPLALPDAMAAPSGRTDAPTSPTLPQTDSAPPPAQRAAPLAIPPHPAAPPPLAEGPRSENRAALDIPRAITAPPGHPPAPILTGPQPAPTAPVAPPDAPPAATDTTPAAGPRAAFTPFPLADLHHAVEPVIPASAQDRSADVPDAAPIPRSLLSSGPAPGAAPQPTKAELPLPPTAAPIRPVPDALPPQMPVAPAITLPDPDNGRTAAPAAITPSLPSGPDAATRASPVPAQAFPSRQPVPSARNSPAETASLPERQGSTPEGAKPPTHIPAIVQMHAERPTPAAAPILKGGGSAPPPPELLPPATSASRHSDTGGAPYRPAPSAPPKPSVAQTVFPSMIDLPLPPMPRIDGGNGQSGASSAPLAPPTALPDLMARQILPNLTAAGSVTVMLAPIDLGALHFEVTQKGDSLHLHLTVDLPATLDLLRRQGDQLIAELRQAGFANASLSFAASDGHPGNSHSGHGHPQGEDRNPQIDKTPPLPPPAEDRAPAAQHPPRAPTGMLDLRL